MEARLLWEQEVAGSTPASPTIPAIQPGSAMHQHLATVDRDHLSTRIISASGEHSIATTRRDVFRRHSASGWSRA